MSQAEAVKMMRLMEEVEQHRAQIAELRDLIVKLENVVNGLVKAAGTPKGR